MRTIQLVLEPPALARRNSIARASGELDIKPLLQIAVCAGTTALLLLPASAGAHSFGHLYNLPVPFWLYGFGAAAALVLSFVIVGVFVAAPASAAPEGSRDIAQLRWVRVLRRARLVPALQVLSVVRRCCSACSRASSAPRIPTGTST